VSAYTHRGECSTLDPCLRCKEFGETQERERIIALLEAEKGNMATDELEWGIDAAIALIKGDNK
jgi:hypothetical protein